MHYALTLTGSERNELQHTLRLRSILQCGGKKRPSPSGVNKILPLCDLVNMLAIKDFFFFFCNGRQGKEVHSYANKVQGREHYAIWFVLFQALFSLAIVAPSDGSEIGSELLDTLLIFTAVFQVSHSSVLPVH